MKLYPYQEEGVYFLRNRKRALLYDDPGLGKTAQTLSALPASARTIIICPASVKNVWKKEIAQWLPHVKTEVLNGRKSFRLPAVCEAVVLNPDILPDVFPRISHAYNLVLDEVHQFKSVSSLRFKRLKLLRTAVLNAGGSIWGLTGTPLMSRPEDLWGILSALQLVTDAYTGYNNFIRVFNGKKFHLNGFSKISWGTPTEEASECLKKVGLGRKREKVLPNLPVKTYEEYEVSVRAYETIKSLTEEDVAAMVEKPGWLSTERERVALEKTQACLPWLKDVACSEPVVIFTTHTESANLVAKTFDTVPITGNTSQNNRVRVVDDFMSGKTNVIVGTIFAMGVGLTLTRSNRVVFINRDWTPALNLQAEDRVCRIGQTRGVIVSDVVSEDPTEKLLYSVLNKKQMIIDNSIEKSR
jgi:SWI/SNF-related matrix-associated actin-dependent regulator of chromatin subfamily A-like protein 1